MKLFGSSRSRLQVFSVLILLIAGCSVRSAPQTVPPPVIEDKPIARMGYTIQVGAFSDVRNAARLTDSLNGQGLDAYYFAYRKGFYKVRFGNFTTEEEARKEAVILKAMGSIDDFYVVRPDEYSVTRAEKYGKTYLREQLVKTARTFIGVPYRWGGTSVQKGFDCSGLTMAIYKLNGLNLPRTSRQQYQTGTYVGKITLLKGDLVFFDTSAGDGVSHVGIYIGDGKFIHAPRKGKTVRTSSLANEYYKKRYSGARSYL